jgi:hypothetical protein
LIDEDLEVMALILVQLVEGKEATRRDQRERRARAVLVAVHGIVYPSQLFRVDRRDSPFPHDA